MSSINLTAKIGDFTINFNVKRNGVDEKTKMTKRVFSEMKINEALKRREKCEFDYHYTQPLC